jgi:large subunit ribosomal protein L35
MNKPIYRYLAKKKWESYQRKLIVQRIDQLSIVPDLLPHFEPTADVRLAFRRRNVHPGDFVDSRLSEVPARLNVQVFDKGERLVTVAVVDPDIPIVELDRFLPRLHYLATNIPLSPTSTSLPLSKVSLEDQLVFPWIPPFAQKGSPYHRLSVFVLEQQPGQKLDVEALKEKTSRDGFRLQSFVDRHRIQPIGVAIFRSTWDEGTAAVMERAGIEGADIEFKRKRIEPLKPKQKPKGWEARHASDKYLSLRR